MNSSKWNEVDNRQTRILAESGFVFVCTGYSFIRRKRSELLTTKTLLKAIAPAAIIGFNM